jgi:hypothetical protein
MEEDNTVYTQETLEIRLPAKERDKLDAAFDRVYQRYGHDLSAFFRDAYHEVTRQATEKKVREDKL